MKNILITGGSGLIGQSLARRLKAKGFTVFFLGRKKPKRSNIEIFEWNLRKRIIDEKAFREIDTVIHLAGANVSSGRWTAKRKKEIYESRIHSTRLLHEYISQYGEAVKTFISASATGFYGDSGETEVDENSPAGQDFLAQTCVDWEKEASRMAEIRNIRTVILRIGLVLSNRGGFYKKIKELMKYWLAAPPAPGTQFQSWIHMEDLCNMIIFAGIEEQVSGIYNAVAPEPVRAIEMLESMSEKLEKPQIFPPIPQFVLRLLLGEMSFILTGGQKVSNRKISEAGFKYRFADLSSALNNLVLQ